MGTAAKFNLPAGIAADGRGNLYVADAGNHRIRKIVIATGEVTTLAGDGTADYADGTGTAAQFNQPTGIALYGGNLYVADSCNYRIRKIVIASGAVTTLAGTGSLSALYPERITVDGSGNLYVTESFSSNRYIRKIDASGVITNLAGSGSGYADGTGTAAKFNQPTGIALYGGNLYVADANNNRIREIVIASGAVTTLAGDGTEGYADGTGTAAKFNGPWDVAADGTGNLYVADYGNYCIRKIVIATGEVTTLAGDSTQGDADGPVSTAKFNGPAGIAVDGSGNIYVVDGQRIRMITPP
jgi:sugar lactone lactonase YvrE